MPSHFGNRWLFGLVVTCLCGACAPPAPTSVLAAVETASATLPAFAVRSPNGEFRAYKWPDPEQGAATVSDEWLEATVQRVDEDTFELTVRTTDVALSEVWFPWPAEQKTLPTQSGKPVLYYPALFGVAISPARLREWDWKGDPYPGGSCAPLAVLADQRSAYLVAATNWPPQRVRPMYSLNRLAMRYETPLAANSQRSYRVTIGIFTGDAARGVVPWQLAVDRYRAWLDARMRDAGLYPIAYSPWLQRIPGWLNIQLNNFATFDVAFLEQYRSRWAPLLPWIQFWGQMSNYAGPPERAWPPLASGERTGCCLGKREIHPRYLPELLDFVRETRAMGIHVGFYARPRDPYQQQRFDSTRRIDGETDLEFLEKWAQFDKQSFGADALYLDTLGNLDYGSPLFVARVLRDKFSSDTVIEGVTDIYPCAFLISGFLNGGSWGGGPQRTLDGLGTSYPWMTFPRFGRYLLNDRIVLLGESNRDWDYWGREHDHWAERQAFLLGAKLDAMHPMEDQARRLGQTNQAVAMILEEWERVRWWARRPVYLDNAGIHDLPAGVDVRVFRGKDGETLFAVDNWQLQTGRTFGYRDLRIPVPEKPLAVMILDVTPP